MIPTTFPEANVTYAENQPEYLPLPAYRTPNGVVTSCWRLSLRERLRVLFGGRVYLTMLTFNDPLQPVKLATTWEAPIKLATTWEEATE